MLGLYDVVSPGSGEGVVSRCHFFALIEGALSIILVQLFVRRRFGQLLSTFKESQYGATVWQVLFLEIRRNAAWTDSQVKDPGPGGELKRS